MLQARLLETRALREALHWRDVRFARLADEHVRYERAMERDEGLARSMEVKFARQTPSLPSQDFPALQVRSRAYETGAAYALLLDRLGGAWRSRMERVGAALDELLRKQVHRHAATDERELAETHGRVRAAAVEFTVSKRAAAADFVALPERRVLIRLRAPLWPQGFDPLNVMHLGEGMVLHARFLRFGNAGARGELLGGQCRTWSSGTHPFKQGFAEVEVAGLQDVRFNDSGKFWSANGLSLGVTSANVTGVPGGWLVELD